MIQGRLRSNPSYVLLVLLLAYILSFIDRNIMAILVGPIRAQFAIDDFQYGLLQGLAFTLFYTLLGLPIGRLADRFNRRTIIALGIFFWSIMTCLCGLATSFTLLFLMRMGVGIGEAALSPPAHSLLADYFSEETLPRAMAVFTLGINIGGGTAYMIGGWAYGLFAAMPAVELPLVGTLAPWQLTFIAVGLPGLIAAALALSIVEPPRRGLMPAGSSDHGAALPLVRQYLLQHRAAYGAMFVAISLLSVLGYSFMSWYVEHLIRRFGADRAVLGPQFGFLFIIVGSLGALAGGWISSVMLRRGKRDANARLVMWVAILWCLPGTAAPLVDDFDVAFWLAAPSLFFLSSYFGVAIAALQLVTPNQLRAQLSALLLFATNLLGLGLGPALVGWLAAHVYGGTNALGLALATLFALLSPLAAIISGLGLKHYRQLQQHASAWRDSALTEKAASQH